MYKNLFQENKNYINFDNAATTPPLIGVLEEINSFSPYYSSVHRGGLATNLLYHQIIMKEQGKLC